jgi:hypothetical protein
MNAIMMGLDSSAEARQERASKVVFYVAKPGSEDHEIGQLSSSQQRSIPDVAKEVRCAAASGAVGAAASEAVEPPSLTNDQPSQAEGGPEQAEAVPAEAEAATAGEKVCWHDVVVTTTRYPDGR